MTGNNGAPSPIAQNAASGAAGKRLISKDRRVSMTTSARNPVLTR